MWCVHTYYQFKVLKNRPTTARPTGIYPAEAARGNSTWLPWWTYLAIMMTVATINDSSYQHGRCHYGSYPHLRHQPFVYVHPSLFYQLLFLPVDVTIIVIAYLTLIMLIVVYLFGIFDRVFPGWDPVPDTHKPSLWRIICRCPNHSPQDHRWNGCQKR